MAGPGASRRSPSQQARIARHPAVRAGYQFLNTAMDAWYLLAATGTNPFAIGGAPGWRVAGLV